MYSPKTFVFVVALALSSCTSQTIPATTPTTNTIELSLLATTATAPLLVELITEYKQVRGDLVFTTSTNNFESLERQVNSSSVPLYFLSTHLPAENTLWVAPIAQDSIAVIVHPENDIQEMSVAQIRDIYTGRISQWSLISNLDESITVISREDGSGTRAEFEDLIIGERRTIQSAQVAPSSIAVVESVRNNRAAIGYVSGAFLDNTINQIIVEGVSPTTENVETSQYPLRSTIFIIGTQEPDGEMRAFVGWVQSPAGQAVVSRRYAPLLR